MPGDLEFGAEVFASRHEVSLADARMVLLRISAVAQELDVTGVLARDADPRLVAADLLAACDDACVRGEVPDRSRERPGPGERPVLRLVDRRQR